MVHNDIEGWYKHGKNVGAEALSDMKYQKAKCMECDKKLCVIIKPSRVSDDYVRETYCNPCFMTMGD